MRLPTLDPSDVHVYPVEEAKSHVFSDSWRCPCHPERHKEDPRLVVHKSLERLH